MALGVRREEQDLRQVVRVLELMAAEIHSRLTPTGELCELAAELCHGPLRDVFRAAAQRIALGEEADVGDIMESVLVVHGERLSLSCILRLRELGSVLGVYEAQEQIRALEALRVRVNGSVEELHRGRRERCRSMEVMGVCAGCALTILLL